MSKAAVPHSAPDPVRRILPYKDFLQPALHRRFSSTAVVLLATSYVLSLSISSWSSWLWAWFPLSSAGFRAYSIFFCGLIIIILRIAQYHIGIRTSPSPFHTFLHNVLTPKTAETLFSYSLTGWLYGQVFRWSTADRLHLHWVTFYSGERALLNERPLFFLVHVVVVGVLHAVLHLFWDNDRLVLGTAGPAPSPDAASSSSSSTASTSSTVSASSTASSSAASAAPRSRGSTGERYGKLGQRLPFLLISAFTRSIVSPFLSMPLYFFFLRAPIWRFTLMLFRPFYYLPKSSLLPDSHPFLTTASFVPYCIWAGFLFSVLLVVSNAAFSIFLVTEPLKNGKPLTADSKDPNGSLLNGLASKKPNIKAFALWELASISRDFPERRVSIYKDIERKDGSMWEQTCRICLDVVKSLEARIDPDDASWTEEQRRLRKQKQEEEEHEQAKKEQQLKRQRRQRQQQSGLNEEEYADEYGHYGQTRADRDFFEAERDPKRLTRPVREKPGILVVTPKKKFQSEVEKVVTKVVLDPQASPRLSPLAKKVLGDARAQLAAVQRDMSGPANPDSVLQQCVRRVLALPILGWPFRYTYRSRITAAVLGSGSSTSSLTSGNSSSTASAAASMSKPVNPTEPYGEPSLYINAIHALRLLAVHSLQEDTYGHVQRDVAEIIRTFTSVTTKLDAFRVNLPIHWTDVLADRTCPEVDEIRSALKDALVDLLSHFGQYARDLRLSQADVRLAEEAATASLRRRRDRPRRPRGSGVSEDRDQGDADSGRTVEMREVR